MRRIVAETLLAAALGAAGCDGGGASATAPGWKPASESCGQSIAALCATGQPPCRWSAWSDATQYPCAHVFLGQCGSYQVARVMGVDSGQTYYYDASGALVAYVTSSPVTGMTDVCAAGPSAGFAEPQCPAGALVQACPTGAATPGP